MKLSNLMFLLAIILIASGCAPSGSVPAPTAEPTVPPSATDALANTNWRLVSFGVAGAESPVIEGTSLTLEFGADGQVGGSGGCNSFGGEYQVNGTALSISNIVSTLIACADERVMEQEQRYFQALEASARFELAGDRLTISHDDGQGALNFVKDSPSALW
ncbi:MAG TPA: META domain-containing protein [Anaerolineae bacterium]|nr:META domain-containing protein [Anaerolineae bacterium]